MNQPLYIQSAVTLSPQHTFSREEFLRPVVSSTDGKLVAIDTDYRPYINPVAIRRMSRMVKMAIGCAMQSLRDAEVACPDGIITGTGRGSMTDMEHFLNDLIRLEEGAMNPTSFIQSTYNSPNGWIAMQVKCTSYNQTYVHRGSSLELALLDTQLLLAEAGTRPTSVLTGCYDEITDEYILVKSKVGYWKTPAPDSLSLLQHSDTAGTIGGEGCTFFTFSNQPGKAHSVIREVVILQDADEQAVGNAIDQVLGNAGLEVDAIDLVLAGMNGDKDQQHYYHRVLEMAGNGIPLGGFKHLCGEFDTSTGFALWLCDDMIRNKEVPEVIRINQAATRLPRRILLVNHYILGSASVMLVEAADN